MDDFRIAKFHSKKTRPLPVKKHPVMKITLYLYYSLHTEVDKSKYIQNNWIVKKTIIFNHSEKKKENKRKPFALISIYWFI